MITRAELNGYKGLYNFHKYWGKKPAEVFQHVIELFSTPGDTVLDPFLGSGVLARECFVRSRHFIGIDINPVAIHIARLLVSPPSSAELENALTRIRSAVAEDIHASYVTNGGDTIATHYLWDNASLRSIWTKGPGRARIELEPSDSDYQVYKSFCGYTSRHIRPIRLFNNSRINAVESMQVSDLFTGRAQRNIDLILDAVDREPDTLRNALKICLTSSIGQMSQMVFAITGRGKTTGAISSKVEVGSWVIGYWRPSLHFEVNAWNCFDRRAMRLVKALRENEQLALTPAASIPSCKSELMTASAIDALPDLPSNSVDLIVTDPPHSDRIPYLELSELWNAVLNENVCFEGEIVISNAKGRNKHPERYQDDLAKVFGECRRVLKDEGVMVVLFNARDTASWAAVRAGLMPAGTGNLEYVGSFESHYSAGSVVQDNRSGGLQHDFGLVFQKAGQRAETARRVLRQLQELPGWTTRWPSERIKDAV